MSSVVVDPGESRGAELAVSAERPRRLRRPLGVVVIDRVWRFFCSVRVALYEIVFLALLVLVGTLKGSIIPAQIPKYVPALEPLVERWYAFDVFHSLIFSATLAVIAVAIVICTANRVPGIWRSIARPTVVTTRAFFHSADPAVTFQSGRAVDEVAGDLVASFKRRRYRVLTERRGADVHVYADKHRFGKLGTFPFHLALILILVGGIVGSEFGFRELAFAVSEGTVQPVGRGTGLRLGLDRFVDNYTQIGAPTEYRSEVVLYDGAREVRTADVSPNHPLTYEGVTFYQSSYGQAATIRVTDAAGAFVYEDTVPFMWRSRTNMNAPAGTVDLPTLGVRLEMFFPNNLLDETPEINDIKLFPGEIYAQARDVRTNQLVAPGAIIGQGDAADLGGLTLEFVRERRFSVFQVAYNPGIPILFAASFLLVLGLAITFYFPHRRVRALVAPGAAGADVLLAPLARRDWGAKRDFARTLATVERTIGPSVPYGRFADVGG